MLEKLIVMLTHNDMTVKNAKAIFLECKDLPVKNWGFKDVGMEPEKMKELAGLMKEAGKETFLEVVTYSEDECMNGAKLAVECGFDYLVGTLFYEKVYEFIKTTNLKYCPFVGKVSGSPSVLEGTLEEMLEQDASFANKGVFGTDLLGYRYRGGDPRELSAQFVKRAKLPTVLAGSIGSEERLEEVRNMDPWRFTMGGALFTENFVKGGSVKANLEKVIELL